MIESESIPFLHNKKSSLFPRPAWSTIVSSNKFYIWFHGMVLILYSTLFFCLITLNTESCHPQLVWSPAYTAVKYEARTTDGMLRGSKYAGPPTPQTDAAWTNLTRGMNIKLSNAEMNQLGYPSLEMRDGSGYLASLGVYHQLHCVKRLRRWLYKEHYYENLTTDDLAERLAHTEHCLETLRQAIMCHGDVGIIPFQWLHDPESGTYEPTTQMGALHTCVNWERLNRWAVERRVDLFDEDLLIRP